MMWWWYDVAVVSQWCEQVECRTAVDDTRRPGAPDAEREARGKDDEDKKGKVSLFS
jgi:hypothetical protein